MKVTYHCAERTVDVQEADRTILDVSISFRIPHLRECGGNGLCTTCRVRILDGAKNLSPRTKAEATVAAARGWDNYTRLACQTRVRGDIALQRLLKTSAEVSQLQIEALPEGTGKKQDLAILFCDMRNFTPFVESRLAFDVVHILNRFFGVLGDSILLNSGLIYQYVGDEITGLFGLGNEPAANSCVSAVRAGLGMLESLDRLNEDLVAHFEEGLVIGIGVHFGTVIAGRIGHPTDRRFAIVGDAINVASRIQETNKELGTQLLVSEQVISHLPPSALRTGKMSSVALKGKRERFTVHEVVAFAAPDPLLLVQATWKSIVGQGSRFVDCFYNRLFSVAPELRALFSGDMSTQSVMLTQMLETVIYATDRPEHLALGLVSLGRRHAGYGVRLEHYQTVRDALLYAIRSCLKERYTPEVAQAWENTLDALLDLMKKGAQTDRSS